MGDDLTVGKIKWIPNPIYIPEPSPEELMLNYLHQKIDSLDKKLDQIILELEIIKGIVTRP